MAKQKREPIPDWLQDARDLAKAERELEIVHWVRITIGYRNDENVWIHLYQFDFPRDNEDRYFWVVRWRMAKLQCQYPRFNVTHYRSHYDKRTGLKTDFNSCLGRLAASKAQITKAKRSEEEYIAEQRKRYPMFYDPATDPELEKFRRKLERKEETNRQLAANIQRALEIHQAGVEVG